MTYTKTVTITRRTRSLGYGCTSHVSRDGGIASPKRQLSGLTPRALLSARRDEVRAVGGNPTGGDGCRYREAFWVGDARVVFGECDDASSLLWDLASLRDGDVNELVLTIESNASNESALHTARARFAAQFLTSLDAVEFEDQALSVGVEFLPECARAVLNGEAATIGYYAWLVGQTTAS